MQGSIKCERQKVKKQKNQQLGRLCWGACANLSPGREQGRSIQKIVTSLSPSVNCGHKKIREIASFAMLEW